MCALMPERMFFHPRTLALKAEEDAVKGLSVAFQSTYFLSLLGYEALFPLYSCSGSGRRLRRRRTSYH